MLRTNLSTRPFYNERAVQLVLLMVGLLVAILTAYNAIRVVSLSRQNTELSAVINRDLAEAERLTADAQRIRAGIDQERLKAIAEAASRANILIDQRTFSWTEFFNRIEATLPPDVMLTTVQPAFKQNLLTIQMAVLGRRAEDIDDFMEELEATGAFRDVLLLQQDLTEQGLHRGVLQTIYAENGAAAGELPEGAPPEGTQPAPQEEAAP